MTQKKPITDKAILLYYDYEFLFEGLTDEELGETIRLLYKNNKIEEPQLNQSKNRQVNFVYNYIISRIIDYKKTKGFFSEAGKTGGNPALLGNTLKGGDKGGVNTGDILKEKKRKENIKEYNIIEIAEEIYKLYSLKEGKKKGIEKLTSYLQKSKNVEVEVEKIKNHILQYNEKCKKDNYKFMKHFDTYINQEPWNDDIPVEKSKTTADIHYLAKRIKDGFGIFVNQNGARVEKSNIVYDGITDYTLDDNQVKQLNDILGGSNE